MADTRIYPFRPLCLLLASGMIMGCQQDRSHSGDLESILQSGQLVVVTRNAPTTYYELHDEATGPEYDLTQAFAKSLGVDVHYIVKDTVSEVLAAVNDGEADIAAAGLTRTAAREQQFLFGPVYQHVQQQLVCRAGGKAPDSIANLDNLSLSVPTDTSYEEKLQELQQDNPQLHWQSSDEDTESLLEQVWEKKLDCTVADSNIVAINRRYYPELRVRFNLSKPEPLSWILPARAKSLQKVIFTWFAKSRRNGSLETVIDRYYGYINEFDYVDMAKFKRRIKLLLPRYQDEFEAAADKYNLDWTLLAAQAYQESHWKPGARSPTGVRGIMMLTLDTAKELGVASRLNPQQSIFAGAEYYHSLYQRIPENVVNPDRHWLALAAYNIGLGHLRDARLLAMRLGKDPDRWNDLARVFPLLSKKKYYKTLKHGYARGREPVSYVQHIRDYHNILIQTLGETAAN